MKKSFRMILIMAALLMPAAMWAQWTDYRCNFNDPADTDGWVFVNDGQTNVWCIDTLAYQSDSGSLYITTATDTTHSHNYNTSATSIAYAYREVGLEAGGYVISYKWLGNGESNYDYLRVFLAPRNANLIAGLLPNGTTSSYSYIATTPAGWISLDGGRGLNGTAVWQERFNELYITTSDTFKLVFMWAMDGGGGTQPPAAVDDVEIYQPTCGTPQLPTITNLTPNTFDLSWVDPSGAIEWLVEIDSANQVQGQGYVESIFDTIVSFTGLTANTQYTVYVAAICSGNDTSRWMRVPVRTPCTLLTTLPFNENFESLSPGSNTSTNFINCWYRLNNGSTYFGWPYVSSNSNYRSGTQGLYWYAATTIGTYGDYMCAVLPGVDTTVLPVQMLQLTFWARATSSSYVPEFQVGVMSNPNDISTFVPVRTVTVSSNWTAVLTDFSTYTGNGNFVAIRALRPTSAWYAYMDDISLDVIPDCPAVCNVTATETGSAGALVTWGVLSAGMGTVTSYQVEIDSVGSQGPATTYTTTEPRYLFSYLSPGTQYKVRVRALCSNDSIGAWDSVMIATLSLPCAQADPTSTHTVTFSNGTTTASGVPVYSGWGNTVCQSIYTAAELTAAGVQAGVISGLTLGYNSAGSYSKDIYIYMGTTTRTTFSTVSDQLPLDRMTLVCGPVLRSNNTSSVGWINYPFTTPFVWDGVSNLVITIFVNQHGGNHTSSGFSGYATSANATRTIYRYKDSAPFTVANCTSGSGGTSTYRPSVSFTSYDCLQYSTCAQPMVFLARNEADTVEVQWAPGYQETSWSILYKEPSDTAWTLAASALTSPEYVFSTLSPNTSYMLRVVPNCGSDTVYAELQFSTPCVPVDSLPFIEDFESFTATSTSGSSVTSCWNRISSYSYTASPYISTSYSRSGTRSLYYYTPSSYHSALVLPAFATPLDSLQISFAAYSTSASYSIKVGVMTDPNDFSTFVEVAHISPSQLNQWEMFEVPLNTVSASQTAHYIALAQANASSYNYMYIDDIEVNRIPPCPRPNNITFTNVTTSTAMMRWNSPGTDFDIEYGRPGFTRGTGVTLPANADSLLLYGLEHSTRYEVYVRAHCSTGDSSEWSFATYLVTACSTIDTLPFKENFSGWGTGTSARPACWTFSTTNSYPYIINLTDATGEIVTGQVLNMYCYNTRLLASLPELDSVYIPSNTVRTVFRAWSTATSTYSSGSLIVGLCSTPGDNTTFTPFDTIELSSAPRLYEVAFDSVAGAGRYITFLSTPASGFTYNYVYLDSVAVELIPACQAPNHLTSSNTLFSSTTLAWHNRGTASMWQIEYGPEGFAHGAGQREVATSNPYTLTNVNPSTTYEYYVRSICGTGDTSEWSLTPGMFITQQVPATIPYFYDFEADTEWYNWQTNSNTTITWYRDTAAGNGTNGYNTTGIHSMYISADSGITCSTDLHAVVNAVAYRDIDFGTDRNACHLLTFRACSGGTSSQGYDGMMVLIVNPYTPVVASNGNITSPWGDYTVLSPLTTVRCSGNWNTYSALLDTLTGIHRLAFFWFNQATGDMAPFTGKPAAVDDVSIVQVGCPRPTSVRATSVSVTMADIEWDGPANATYRVHCRAVDGSAYFNDSVNTTFAHLTGLAPGTQYKVQVRHLCSATDSSTLSVIYEFTTPLCAGSFEDTIGALSSTTTSSYLPLSTSSRYSYSQQIVRASELTGAGEISAINLYYAYSSAITTKISCTIYMGHTTLSSFTDADAFAAPDSLQVVYVGRIDATTGWNRIVLQDPFVYNGVDNLVIAVDDNSAAALTTYYTYQVSPAPATMSLCYYSTSVNPDPTSRATLNAFTGTKGVYAYRNQMILELCPQNPCPNPRLRSPQVRTNSVTLRWRNTSDRYNFSYRRATTTSWIVDGLLTTDTSVVLTSLSPMTEYVYRVRQYCDSTGVSNWAYGRFNTGELPCLPPEGLELVSTTNSKAKFRWTPEENNIKYKLHVFNSVFEKFVTSFVASGTCTGLEAGRTYYAAVSATCAGMDEPSEWSDTISFTTAVCPDVRDVVVSDIQGNSVVVDWTEGGIAEQWEIEYGPWGFGQGFGTKVLVNAHPYTLDHLHGSMTYDLYVRAVCGDNFVSEHWSEGVTFTTEYSSIGSVVDDARVNLYPNPTSADVELSMPASADVVMVEVIDMTGRVCQSHSLQANTDRFVIPASLLTQGAYYVRITGVDINAVKKLIVR